MRTRRLGAHGPEISILGFGAWEAGGDQWGHRPEEDAIRAMHAAIDAGITWIDTAEVYGNGRSEELVGKVLRDRPGEVMVFTKVAPLRIGPATRRHPSSDPRLAGAARRRPDRPVPDPLAGRARDPRRRGVGHPRRARRRRPRPIHRRVELRPRARRTMPPDPSCRLGAEPPVAARAARPRTAPPLARRTGRRLSRVRAAGIRAADRRRHTRDAVRTGRLAQRRGRRRLLRRVLRAGRHRPTSRQGRAAPDRGRRTRCPRGDARDPSRSGAGGSLRRHRRVS
jgi:hypothetical protein